MASSKWELKVREYQLKLAQLERVNLDISGGVVIDPNLPKHMNCIVCSIHEVVACESDDFLRLNSTISDYIRRRDEAINDYHAMRAADKAWAHRHLSNDNAQPCAGV